MKRFRAEPTLRQIRKTLQKTRKESRREFQEVFNGRYSDASRRIARDKIVRRMREFLAFEPWVIEPDADHEHHEMRIAAKRLRYAMEIFDPLWGGALKEATGTVKSFQRLLGSLHDCVVWIQHLSTFLESHEKGEQSRDPTPQDRPGLEYLLQDRQEERHRLYREFAEGYRAIQAERFWESLRETLNCSPANAASDPTSTQATKGGDDE
jgi:CHAD domain-containing protein